MIIARSPLRISLGGGGAGGGAGGGGGRGGAHAQRLLPGVRGRDRRARRQHRGAAREESESDPAAL